jgi:hypothetical protein
MAALICGACLLSVVLVTLAFPGWPVQGKGSSLRGWYTAFQEKLKIARVSLFVLSATLVVFVPALYHSYKTYGDLVHARNYLDTLDIPAIMGQVALFIFLALALQRLYRRYLAPQSIVCPLCGRPIPLAQGWRCGCKETNNDRDIFSRCRRCGRHLTSTICPRCRNRVEMDKKYN